MALTWSRRSFLKTLLAGSAACLVTPVYRIGAQIVSPSPVLDVSRPFWIEELWAWAVEGTTSPVHLCLSRKTNPILVEALYPQSYFHWVATLGNEIAGQDLVNDSSADLDVTLIVRQDDRHWRLNRDGTCVALWL